MRNKDEIRAAQGPRVEQARKRQVSEQELDQVNGGQRGGTYNKFCSKCGFVTPHSPNEEGGYSCNYCGTVCVIPRS